MKWFSGNMLQAIAEAHSRRVLLLVFVEGDDMASHNMHSTFEDAEVNKLIDVMGCVPIRLQANSSACRQFNLVYPVTAIPSAFFISSRGNLEASVVGFTDPVSLSDRLVALMASCTLRKVDSDMRNASDASLSLDRMTRANRHSSSARLPVSVLAAEGARALSRQPPAEGVAKKRSKGGERRSKRKHKIQEANVQTSIVVLAEQSTQINMDDRRSYNSLLQKLRAMEEATLVSRTTVTTAEVHGDLAGDLGSLMGDSNEKKDLGITPEELSGYLLAGTAGAATGGESVDVEMRGKPAASNDDKREMADAAECAENCSNEHVRPGSHKNYPKGNDEINATTPPQPPPLPPPPPAAEAVRVTEVEHPTSAAVSDVPLVGPNDIDSVSCDAADGSSLLIKFAVLAHEFADKVLGSTQCEHSDTKSLETSAAETTKASANVRRFAESSQKQKSKKEQQVTKSKAPPPAKNVEIYAKEERHSQYAGTFKRSCRLECLQGSVGDAAKAIAALQEAAFGQEGDKDTWTKKRGASSGARSQKQPRNSESQQSSTLDRQAKHSSEIAFLRAKQSSEKRKMHREYPAKHHAGYSKTVTTTLQKATVKAAAVFVSSTRVQDTGVSQIAQKIKLFETAAVKAQDATVTLDEKRMRRAEMRTEEAKRPNSASPPKPQVDDNPARSPENGSPPKHVQMPPPPPPPPPILEHMSVMRARPGIETITEEEPGAVDSCLTSPQPTPSPPRSPLPPSQDARTQPEVQKVAEDKSYKSSMNEPGYEAAAPPLPLSQAPSPQQQQTTQTTVAQNRNPPQSRKSARRPSSPTKSKEFLTASNSQLEEALVFGPTHRTSDDSAAVTTKRAPPSHLRPREQRAMAARSPLYERLVNSDGDDETVDEELTVRRTPSAAAFRGEADWMDEMARTASRRTLLYRAGVFEESLNNLCRTLNDVEVPTVSLSVSAQSRTNIAKAPPVASPSKQRFQINDKKADGADEGKASGVQAIAGAKATHRVSLSGTNFRNRARSRATSSSRLGGNVGCRSPNADASRASGVGNARKTASFTPTAVRGGAGGGADDANIVLNLPNGSSVQKLFPASAYLDEVRWYTEELLASTLPSCFPFTMVRTRPLREFSREEYRKTLEQLRLAPSATLLVLPRSAAQGESGLLPSGMMGEPMWVALFRLVFGMFVATPLSLVWNLLNCPTDPAAVAAREAFLSGTLGSSTLSTLPPGGVATPARSASSGGLCRRRPSSHTDNFDIF
ncbi:uncharacterized protein [Dermacentor albipictus]|uniref:uncharacterized protein n=1 Tax=Dermacentor albipictus TaxID=60249 RepID=UPI0031FCBB55